ncbi:MAG: transcriptional regulator [Clostridia bacterium]|nr:transcriptional regulator [Clostridia bacterium]MBQ7061568.1 transcriptional regulator [Clostridia bacterium]
MDLDFYKRLASALAQQFGSNCEIALHDLTGDDPDHTIAVIENGHVTHRKVGDGPSRIVLEALHTDDPAQLSDSAGYLMKTHDGRILKSSTVYIRNEHGGIDGVFSINYDITELLMAERAIDSILNHKVDRTVPERIPISVNDLLDDLIEQAAAKIGKPVAMMTKDDKIRAIRFLNNAGAFLVTRSGDKVSKYFGISKYTLYSYIDAKTSDET